MGSLEIKIGGLAFKNPVLAASGTFGYGEEFKDFINLNLLGGFIVKGTTLKPREGNPYPRMAETSSGMLNAVGLQNKGIDYFINNIYPNIKVFQTNTFVNISGSNFEEYIEVAERVNELDKIPGIELNISCPNVKEGGMVFGTHCPSAAMVTKKVRQVYNKLLIVKLSPNVTDITEFAKAVEGEGADCVSIGNTLLGMAIDAQSRRPKLSTITGGLSGPAIKPIILRMVWQCYNAIKIPIIGLGGIMNATDAIEYFLAGAKAIQVGTANFIDPQVTIKVIDGINNYLDKNNIFTVGELTGGLITK